MKGKTCKERKGMYILRIYCVGEPMEYVGRDKDKLREYGMDRLNVMFSHPYGLENYCPDEYPLNETKLKIYKEKLGDDMRMFRVKCYGRVHSSPTVYFTVMPISEIGSGKNKEI